MTIKFKEKGHLKTEVFRDLPLKGAFKKVKLVFFNAPIFQSVKSVILF